MPYIDRERTPNLPHATGQLSGLTLSNATPTNLARAAVEGMLCGLADAVEALEQLGVPIRRVILVGGAARSAAVAAIAPMVLGHPVLVADPGEYVADGAARQAARAWLGSEQWPAVSGRWSEAAPTPVVREAYAVQRDAAYP
jgi:xylulokinase